MALRQFLDAVGTVELGPFGAQAGDRVLLAPHLGAQLGDALGLQRRLVFDLVDIGRREHERGEHHDMQQAPDHRVPRGARARITSASDRQARQQLRDIAADRRRAGALRGAQLGGARARVRGKFLLIRDDRLARQHG